MSSVPPHMTKYVRGFLESMLQLEDPTIGSQMNVGRRRTSDGRPIFVEYERARVLMKGDKEKVVALGNGGWSPISQPENEWYAGSVVGKVNGSIPLVLNSDGVDPKSQFIYAAPILIMGNGNKRVNIFQVAIKGPATLSEIKRTLRSTSDLSRVTYGLIELNDLIHQSASVTYSASYSATYSYPVGYKDGKYENVNPIQTVLSGEPLTILLSANKMDVHGIKQDGYNVHLNHIELPAGASASGVLFSLI